jgi:hypothetical protein
MNTVLVIPAIVGGHGWGSNLGTVRNKTITLWTPISAAAVVSNRGR